MAEPYVPIADYNTYNALMIDLEITTDIAETYTDDLSTAVSNTLTHKQTVNNLIDSKLNLLFLVGC